AASTKERPRHLTHRRCASECKTSERACRRQSTGAPNTWQNCCGATSKDGLTESRPPESPDSETRRPAGKSAASVSPAPPGLLCAGGERPPPRVHNAVRRRRNRGSIFQLPRRSASPCRRRSSPAADEVIE